MHSLVCKSHAFTKTNLNVFIETYDKSDENFFYFLYKHS